MKNFVLAGLIVVGTFSVGWCGWPLTFYPPIEGRAMDAQTGQPIPNAIVIVQWYAAPLISEPGGAYEVGKEVYGVTDKEGNFKVERVVRFTPFRGGGLRMRICHPLYEGVLEIMATRGSFAVLRKQHQKDGRFFYDVALTPRPEEWVGWGDISINTPNGIMGVSKDVLEYMRAAKMLRIDVTKTVPDWNEYQQKEGIKEILKYLKLRE